MLLAYATFEVILLTKKVEYKPLKKSRKNTSGKPSVAKKEAMKREEESKAKRSGKVVKKKARIAAGTPYKRQPLKAQGSPKPLPESLMIDLKGMRLRTILRTTPRLFHNTAKYVRMLSIKKAKTKSGLTAYLGVMRTHDPERNKSPRKRNVTIIGLDPDSGKPVNKQRVLLQCECESYVFTYEYANAAHNAARLLFCNGAYPSFMNPACTPGACKHLIAFAEYLILSDR